MPVSTIKVDWPAKVQNRTVSRLVQIIRDFVVSNGWTLLTDESAAASPYITVTYNRNTGFTGDNPIVQIYTGTSGTNNLVYFRAYESWNTVSKTGTNSAAGVPGLSYKLANDNEFWFSCAPEFILGANISQDGTTRLFTYVIGVSCIERLPGDEDTGTFYGAVYSSLFSNSPDACIIYVPKLFNGNTSTNASYNVSVPFNSTTGTNVGLTFADQTDAHIVLLPVAHKLDYGRHKGRIYGFALTTHTRRDFGFGTYLPNSTNPEWLVTKWSGNATYNLLMQVSNTVTVVS